MTDPEYTAQYKIRKNNRCDCGELISYNASRCRPCRVALTRGENHPHYKGGSTRTKDGYIHLSGYHGHPNAYATGKIAEHVLVMAEHLGRPLFKGENVHHKNGVRDDNRPENLELWVTSQPRGQRVPDLINWAEEILKRYKNA